MTTYSSTQHSTLASAEPVLRTVETNARQIIRRRPVVAVLSAAGVGYLVARLVTRRSW